MKLFWFLKEVDEEDKEERKDNFFITVTRILESTVPDWAKNGDPYSEKTLAAVRKCFKLEL